MLMLAMMGSQKQAVIGLRAQAVSAEVTKLIVTMFRKTCNKNFYLMGWLKQYDYTVIPVLSGHSKRRPKIGFIA